MTALAILAVAITPSSTIAQQHSSRRVQTTPPKNVVQLEDANQQSAEQNASQHTAEQLDTEQLDTDQLDTEQLDTDQLDTDQLDTVQELAFQHNASPIPLLFGSMAGPAINPVLFQFDEDSIFGSVESIEPAIDPSYPNVHSEPVGSAPWAPSYDTTEFPTQRPLIRPVSASSIPAGYELQPGVDQDEVDSPQEDLSGEMDDTEDGLDDLDYVDDETRQNEDDFSDDDLEEEEDSDDRETSESDFASWPPKDIRSIRIDIRETHEALPPDRSYALINSSVSDWTLFAPNRKVFAWAAPNVRHQPLYFENVAHERYGADLGRRRQFVASAWHFTKSAALLPYSVYVDHPWSCDYPLGYCRPGNVAPTTRQQHFYGWDKRR